MYIFDMCPTITDRVNVKLSLLFYPLGSHNASATSRKYLLTFNTISFISDECEVDKITGLLPNLAPGERIASQICDGSARACACRRPGPNASSRFPLFAQQNKPTYLVANGIVSSSYSPNGWIVVDILI